MGTKTSISVKINNMVWNLIANCAIISHPGYWYWYWYRFGRGPPRSSDLLLHIFTLPYALLTAGPAFCHQVSGMCEIGMVMKHTMNKEYPKAQRIKWTIRKLIKKASETRVFTYTAVASKNGGVLNLNDKVMMSQMEF